MKHLITLIVVLIGIPGFGQKYPDYSREKLLLEWTSIIGGSTFSGYNVGSEFSFHKKRNSLAIKFNYNYQSDKLDWRGLEPDTEDNYSNDKVMYLGLNYGRDFQFKRLIIRPQIGMGYVQYADEHLGLVHVKECNGLIFTSCNEYDQIDQKFAYYNGVGANLDVESTYYVSEVFGLHTSFSLLTSKYQTVFNFSGGFVFCLNPMSEKKVKKNKKLN